MDTEQTRAAIARRRLAQLVASFDEEHVPPAASEPEAVEPVAAPVHRRRVTHLHARLAIGIGVAVAVIVAWSVLSGRPESTPAQASAASPSEPVVETGEIVVDVVGLVNEPGIVTLPAGSRVHEAIEAAGGLVGDVDTTSLNLARKLEDGEQLLVGIAPVAPVQGGAGTGASVSPDTQGRTNLNSATADDLDDLPGVGPVTATAILVWRDEHGPFRSVDDLLEVKGIGEATLDELRDLVTV